MGTGDLANFISTATNGTIASYYQINGIQYPIIVELSPASQRRSFSSLKALEFTPLSTASPKADAKLRSPARSATADARQRGEPHPGLGPSAISREDRQRRVEIGAPISGRPQGPDRRRCGRDHAELSVAGGLSLGVRTRKFSAEKQASMLDVACGCTRRCPHLYAACSAV